MDGLKTPLFKVHQDLGARMIPFGGWLMPVQYTSILDEHHAVRERAGLFDLSHMGEFDLCGSTALADIQRLVTNDAARLAVGQCMYTPMCLENGGIVDDLIVYRRGPERYLLVVNAGNITKDREWVTSHLSKETRFEDQSERTALIAIQGPRAAAVLAGLIPAAAELGPFRIMDAKACGHDVLVARTGYTGEDGFELFVDASGAEALWKALLVEGVSPIGLGARDTLRFEARLLLYGNDIDETTTPLEAGIAWTVKFEKGDFIGRGRLDDQKKNGLQRRLVGFKLTGRSGVARHGYDVVREEKVVGQVTSGAQSPTLKDNLGMAYLPEALSAVGTSFAVRIRDRDVPAQVVATPFYKRKR